MQTYCVASDVEFILSTAGVIACLDDEEVGGTVRSTQADAWLARAIEVAAGRINQAVRHQYKLTDLAGGNEWLRDTNAYLAAKVLVTRRSNPCPESITEAVKERETLLNEIRWGRESIPEQLPSFDHTPTVSTQTPEPGQRYSPIRTIIPESTGDAPVDGVKRNVAGYPYVY